MSFITKSGEIARYGEYPSSRSIKKLLSNGIIILDKWPGPTSHDVVATVKKLLEIEKTGHSGTIDPMVSGVLVITLDNACKVIPALQGQDKEYIGIMHMHKEVKLEEVKRVAGEFLGSITQMPPVKSAVLRKERKRKIHNLEILGMKDKDVLFSILCEAGTYIRVLCHEIGKKLGGAHMKELRRSKAGRFSESEAVKIQDLADAYADWKSDGSEEIKKFILPVEAAIEHLGKIVIRDSAVYSVSNGSPLYSTGISRIEDTVKKNDMVAILTLRGELVALGRAKENAENKGKYIAATVDRVVMTNKYPKK
jgi:H/ACA ribonucleoprotein complex subunit 4